MLKMKNSLILLSLAVLLNACSQFVPFEDQRREAGKQTPVGLSTNENPAICYNPIWHDVEQTKELADAACARTNRKAEFVRSDAFSCRLVNPSAAIYKCK